MREAQRKLAWQSKAIVLLVVPWTASSVVLHCRWWLIQAPVVAWTALGISGVFGLIVWRMRAGTLGAAATGASICASLMLSSVTYPYAWSWLHGTLPPLLSLFLLTYAATKVGRAKKEKLGTGEGKKGRNTAQVAANLGIAALAAGAGTSAAIPNWVAGELNLGESGFLLLFLLARTVAIAALAEAAADTVSSEIGQVFGGEPRLIATWSRVSRGTDGGITLLGTVAGILAATIVAGAGTIAMMQGAMLDQARESLFIFAVTALGGVLGLFFDSLLGQTLERKGWLNNDAVNFLSTLSAPIFATILGFGWLFLLGSPVNGLVR